MPNTYLLEFVEDAESGKVNEYNSTEAFFDKLHTLVIGG
jgi:hypothetical protein